MGSVLKKLIKQADKMDQKIITLQKHIEKTGEQIDVKDLLKLKTEEALKNYRLTRNKRKAARKQNKS
jgi:hypothetical protein